MWSENRENKSEGGGSIDHYFIVLSRRTHCGHNREIYGVNLCIQSEYRKKYGPEKTPYLDTFRAVTSSPLT